MIGSHDISLGHRPIPVMSDSDVLFMTQLSNDIARSVGGISAVRHHGMRTKKRKVGISEEPHFAREYSQQRRSHRRMSRGEAAKEDRGSGSKRTLPSKGDKDKELSCYKCGRTETPEWRKGPEGLLCNVCGLVYAKQRRKLKGG
ncbi:hypothetical protein BD289DRAFT_207542 [Coniella lustricola]|uniref:GATA-type domain-containing protein n=1 Tax=Coniella lustricola TaxID=2025994 RepID=A0A2T3ABX0_9PEZI|nr:hypothetical protein BD289DRAFT_207542 [Coniella lustricola]